MSSTKTSTKPCLDEQRPDASRGWDDPGLVEAAFEGRLARHDGIYVAHARMPSLQAAPAATGVSGSGSVPLHVPTTASQVPMVRQVETSRPDDSPTMAIRTRMIRALGLVAAIVVALLLADVLS